MDLKYFNNQLRTKQISFVVRMQRFIRVCGILPSHTEAGKEGKGGHVGYFHCSLACIVELTDLGIQEDAETSWYPFKGLYT